MLQSKQSVNLGAEEAQGGAVSLQNLGDGSLGARVKIRIHNLQKGETTNG